ncbi:MAG TPA: DUF2231 domain-containing protein [Myxococcales bacterium]|nr:DUF2231 domain-containing protein [Myxococcales bacterium]
MPAGELHPFLVHFAIGLLLIAPVADVLGLLFRREALLDTGRWATLLGTLFAALALASGWSAEHGLGPHSAAGEALLRLHGRLGWVTLAAWLPVAGWRAASRLALPLRARTLYLAASFTAAAVLAAEAILGAALVYRHGVGLSPAARAEPLVRPTPMTH